MELCWILCGYTRAVKPFVIHIILCCTHTFYVNRKKCIRERLSKVTTIENNFRLMVDRTEIDHSLPFGFYKNQKMRKKFLWLHKKSYTLSYRNGYFVEILLVKTRQTKHLRKAWGNSSYKINSLALHTPHVAGNGSRDYLMKRKFVLNLNNV